MHTGCYLHICECNFSGKEMAPQSWIYPSDIWFCGNLSSENCRLDTKFGKQLATVAREPQCTKSSQALSQAYSFPLRVTCPTHSENAKHFFLQYTEYLLNFNLTQSDPIVPVAITTGLGLLTRLFLQD